MEKKLRKLFERYLEYYPQGNFESASRYYILAEQEKELGDRSRKENSKEKVKNLFDDHILSYYSMTLGKKYPKLFADAIEKHSRTPKALPPNITHTDEIKNHILSYKELKKLKLEDYAKEILNDLNTHRFSLDSRKYLISFYKKINHTAGQIVNSIRIFYDYKEERSLVSLRDIFPIRQEETIKSTLARLQFKKIPSTLILSLIRQESAFDQRLFQGQMLRDLCSLFHQQLRK